MNPIVDNEKIGHVPIIHFGILAHIFIAVGLHEQMPSNSHIG